MRSYRFCDEARESLIDLVSKVNAKCRLKLDHTKMIEILIIDAAKNPKKVISMLSRR